MLENDNENYNIQMSRILHYNKMRDLKESGGTPKPNFQNNFVEKNTSNNTNMNYNSLIKKTNQMNKNANMKMNSSNNINNNNNNSNKPTNNNNLIQNNGIITNNINKCLFGLQNEFKKKDKIIELLELKVADLEKKISMIENSSNPINTNPINQGSGSNTNNNILLKKNFTFGNAKSGEISPNKQVMAARASNNKYYPQTNSSNQLKVNNNQLNLEKKYSNIKKENNLNEGMKENSDYTGNSSSYKSHSKGDVKMYLKEVKKAVPPEIFKNFIKNIKLLSSSSKDKNGIDRNIIIENVRLLFGEKYKNLFVKFESIIGINNNNNI